MFTTDSFRCRALDSGKWNIFNEKKRNVHLMLICGLVQQSIRSLSLLLSSSRIIHTHRQKEKY